MTRAAFAELTRLGEATLNRWENGSVVQNRANDRYLRILAIPEVMNRLRDLTTARHAPFPSNTPNIPKFRSLKVSDRVLRRQDDFELRKAS